MSNILTGDQFTDAINRALKGLILKATEEEVEEAKKRLDMRIPEIAAQIAVTVQKALNPLDDNTIIQVRVRPRL
jgi:hypothetical protein